MSAALGTCHPCFQPVHAKLQKCLDEGLSLGASCCLIVDGEVLVDVYGGHMDEKKARPWKEDTLNCVWSVTKAWAGICVLKLVDQGHLNLNAPIADYWPEFAQNGKEKVTVERALNHRTGVQTLRKMIEGDEVYDWQDMTSRIAAEPPFLDEKTGEILPGYHSWTMGLICGELVRRADPQHRTIGQFWNDEIVVPFGLADLFIGLPYNSGHHTRIADEIPAEGSIDLWPEKLIKKGIHLGGTSVMVTTMLNPKRDMEVANTRKWRSSEFASVGGLANAKSIARLYQALGNNLLGRPGTPAVLSQAIMKEATTEHAREGLPMPFGLGFGLSKPFLNKTKAFGHTGQGGQLSFSDPEENLSYGYTCNRMTGDHKLAEDFAELCYDCLANYKLQKLGGIAQAPSLQPTSTVAAASKL